MAHRLHKIMENRQHRCLQRKSSHFFLFKHVHSWTYTWATKMGRATEFMFRFTSELSTSAWPHLLYRSVYLFLSIFNDFQCSSKCRV